MLKRPAVAAALLLPLGACVHQAPGGTAAPVLPAVAPAVDAGPSAADVHAAAKADEALGHAHLAGGRLAESEAAFLRSLEAKKKAFGEDHPSLAHPLVGLAKVAKAQGNHEKAKALMGKAWAAAKVGIASANPLAGLALDAIGSFFRSSGDNAQADKVYEESLDVMEKSLGPKHPQLADTMLELAQSYRSQGKSGEAVAVYNRAFKAVEARMGPGHPKATEALHGMAEAYEEQGDFAEGERTREQALALSQAPVMSRMADLADQHEDAAANLEAQGKWDRAVVHYEKEVSLLEALHSDEDVALSGPLVKLGRAYAKVARPAEAERAFKRAQRVLEAAYGADSPNAALPMTELAAFYRDQGRRPEAEKLEARAAALRAAVPAAPY